MKIGHKSINKNVGGINALNNGIDDKNISDRNVFLSQIEQDAWNDVQAYHIENESAWRNVSILAIICLCLVAVYAIYAVNQDKHKVVVFEKDSLGNVTTLGLATKSMTVDNKIIAHELANFIVALREVPGDMQLKRRNIDLVHKMIDANLRRQIDQMFIDEYTVARDDIVMVTIDSIKPLSSGNSWEVSWSEKAGANISSVITNWSTTITFNIVENVSSDVQIVNPIGLFVNYIHPTQDISNKEI